MTNNSVTEISLAEWIHEYSTFIASETVKLLVSGVSSKGEIVTRRLMTAFLTHLVEMIITRTLKDRQGAGSTKEEVYKHVSSNFSAIKAGVQDAVAEGFSRALSKFAKKDVDYFCIIKPTPEPDKRHYN